MYRLGQIMGLVGVLATLVLSVLLITDTIASTTAGGLLVVCLIVMCGGIAISKKHKNNERPK